MGQGRNHFLIGTSAICCTVLYYKDKENIDNNQNIILTVPKEEGKMDNETSIFNIKFPHCIFYYAHIHILLPVGIVLNLISSVNSAWCFVLAILQIVELILLIKHHKYSYKAFLISEIYFDILYIILNNKLIPSMVGLGTLKIIYMYKRKYILTHSRVEMQYAPTKKENKNIKKLDLSNMVNPYNNKFMLKDKDIAEYILMYNSEDGVCEERQNSKLPQDSLEKNTRTNMQDMLLTDERLPNAEEDAVKKLR